MKVKDLMAMLAELNPNARIMMNDWNTGEATGAYIHIAPWEGAELDHMVFISVEDLGGNIYLD